MEHSRPQKLLAEFVGAMALIFIGAGSIIAAGAAALSANATLPAQAGIAGAGLVTIALAHGLAIGTMVSSLGHISGGHFNPAVTIAAWVTQKIKSMEAVGYIVAQLAGGAAGAALLRAAIPEGIWKQVKLGSTLVGGGISNGQAVLIEAILTFFLVWVVFATAVDPDGAFGKIAGLAIGFVILMDILVGGPFTGASMNPARTFGPALVGGYWTGHWVYWVGPVAGGVVAASLYDTMFLRKPEPVGASELDTPPASEPGIDESAPSF